MAIMLLLPLLFYITIRPAGLPLLGYTSALINVHAPWTHWLPSFCWSVAAGCAVRMTWPNLKTVWQASILTLCFTMAVELWQYAPGHSGTFDINDLWATLAANFITHKMMSA